MALGALDDSSFEFFMAAYSAFTQVVHAWDGTISHPESGDFPPELYVHHVGGSVWAFAWGEGAPRNACRATFAWEPGVGPPRRVIMRNVAANHAEAYGDNK
ncbi:MAG: hypothetical protein JWO69_1440 [Thermoleophilia bacterium]|nr:hypothetical protein [Thermoleophilia bacterium]